MSPVRTTVKATLGAVLAVGATVALTSCGAGQVNTTADTVSAVNGATGHLKQIDILNAAIAFPPGDSHLYQPGESAPLVFTITNAGVQGDKLVSISSPAAKSIALKGSMDLLGGTKIVARTSGSADQPNTLSATMEGLTKAVKPGPTVDVTFTFAQAGTLTLPLPVGSPSTAE